VTWADLKRIMPSGRSQWDKATHCVISFVWHSFSLVLGMEPMASLMLGKGSTTELYSRLFCK
jgi:hypothetical protein